MYASFVRMWEISISYFLILTSIPLPTFSSRFVNLPELLSRNFEFFENLVDLHASSRFAS